MFRAALRREDGERLFCGTSFNSSRWEEVCEWRRLQLPARQPRVQGCRGVGCDSAPDTAPGGVPSCPHAPSAVGLNYDSTVEKKYGNMIITVSGY